jgi:glycerol-3-phosphate O-acyltransferase
MSLKRRLHRLFRKILFLWVRIEILPRELSKTDFPDTPILYVMAERGLSELLVLEHISDRLGVTNPLKPISIHGYRHHSVYSIASRNPVSDWITQQKKHSLMLQELIDAIDADEETDITVVPVSVFWGRAIAKQRHWLKVLFSDTWEVGGRIRKFFTLLINGRNATIIFQTPQSFRQLCQAADHSVENLNDLLTDSLLRQHEATYGPEIASLNDTINKVINSPLVQEAIEKQHEEKFRNKQAGQKQAVKYAREIFSNCTQISLELMKRLLDAFWNKFYSGIEVFNIAPVKDIALTHQLIYVPCHRSHVDYLLLSYVIFHEGLALPYIAAGKNLNMPIIGRILRGGGAFFLRRSFRDKPLYSAVMTEYLYELVRLGVPIEYFIEGGRSRTGRLLRPKLGMLSMTVDGWIRSQTRPLAFVPVYIGYEKLVEGRSYVGELYGHKKKTESLFSSIRSILKLRGQFGKVTTSFGQPIKLDEFLYQLEPQWSQADKDTLKQQDWFRPAVSMLSHEIMQEINRAAVINPVNLIATTMLATPRQSIDQYDLVQQCQFYHRLIASQPQLSGIIQQDQVSDDELDRIHQQGLIDINHHALGDIVYLTPEKAVLMSYYRNNSLHILVIPSLVACCFLNTRTIKQDVLIGIVKYVYPFLASELHLQWNEQQLIEFIPQIIDFLIREQILSRTNDMLKRPDRNDIHYLFLTRLAHIAQPILERYYMTFVVLWESGGNPISEEELEQRCHLVAQKISMLYGINSPDFYDRQLFGHFINTLFELDFIERDEQGHLMFQQSFDRVNVDIRILLSIEVRSTILQLLNSGHHLNLPTGKSANKNH